MEDAINEIVGIARVHLQTLLRGKHLFTQEGLVRLFKQQVVPHVEYATPAIYHAPRFFLNRLDQVEADFLEELGVTAREAFLNLRLLPLSPRRDVAMLDLIHRCVLGKGPLQLAEFFRSARAPHFPRSLRNQRLLHNRQLDDPIDGTSSNSMRRSALGLIYVNNSLPQRTVDLESVNSFQKALQSSVRKACESNLQMWPLLLGSGPYHMPLQEFQACFS